MLRPRDASPRGAMLRDVAAPAPCRDKIAAPYLTVEADPTEAPRRSPRRGPPYWKSRVLRRQTLGEEDEVSRRGGQTRPKALPGRSGRTCPGVREAPLASPREDTRGQG